MYYEIYARVAKRQTRHFEGVVGVIPWRFKSSPAHFKSNITKELLDYGAQRSSARRIIFIDNVLLDSSLSRALSRDSKSIVQNVLLDSVPSEWNFTRRILLKYYCSSEGTFRPIIENYINVLPDKWNMPFGCSKNIIYRYCSSRVPLRDGVENDP